MTIEPGAKTCIVGGSGSGKSVMTKIILGLVEPTAGEVIIDGQNTAGFTRKDWNELMKDFGVVFQGAALFDSLTVLENVGLKLYEDRSYSHAQIKDMVVESLEKVDLDASILDRFPAELSGGMRKRVGISRAIIHGPKYLVYDEPTTGLDPVSSDTIDRLMKGLADDLGVTSIIITHDMFTVESIASHVVMLHNKRLLFNGPPDDFMRAPHPRIRAFLNRSVSVR